MTGVGVQGFNEQELKLLIDSKQLSMPRVESGEHGYAVCFEIGSSLREVDASERPAGTLMTFRGEVKRFRSHRTLIQNMKKLGIARWRCKLAPDDQ